MSFLLDSPPAHCPRSAKDPEVVDVVFVVVMVVVVDVVVVVVVVKNANACKLF